MFRPRVDRCDEEGLDVQFEACPLKSAWLEAGIAEADVALFCEMASEADYGTLEAAGFSVIIRSQVARVAASSRFDGDKQRSLSAGSSKRLN